MAALSRRFTRTASTDISVGTPPPDDWKKPTLSRKVQSELNLTRLSRMDTAESIAQSSISSGFSGGAGDPLPDEIPSPPPALADVAIDCDAIIALREVSHVCELYVEFVLI
jgi:hypothetical protein